MGSSPIGLPVDLLAPPRRRRSPRLAIVFLPLTLALVALFCVARLTLRLAIGLATSVVRAAVKATQSVLALVGLWLAVLVLWFIIWQIGCHISDKGVWVLGYRLCVYWPYLFGHGLLGLLHLAAPGVWWLDRYAEIHDTFVAQEMSWASLLTPLLPPFLVACGAFLWSLPGCVRANVRGVLARGVLR